MRYPKEIFPSVTSWIKANYLPNFAKNNGMVWNSGTINTIAWNDNSMYLSQHKVNMPFFAYLVKSTWSTEEEANKALNAFSGSEIINRTGETLYGFKFVSKMFKIGLNVYQLSYCKPYGYTAANSQIYMQNFAYKFTKAEAWIIPLDTILGTDYAYTRENVVKHFKSLNSITTTKTLKLGSNMLSQLTDEDKKIATDKGWTLA